MQAAFSCLFYERKKIMGINVTHIKDTLLADGVNKLFPFTFPAMDKADVKCLYVLPSGEETDLLAAEYEVRLTDTGGEVTYPLTGDALAEGCKLVIYRETPRTTDYNPQNTTTFDAETISKEIERLTMENQEQDEKLSRAVSISIGSEADPKEYLNEVNKMLTNARELQEMAVKTSEETLDEAEKQKNAAASSAAAAASSEQSAFETVNGFDEHAAAKIEEYNMNATAKTDAFNNNAEQKQAAVDANAELARKYAQGSLDEMASGSAKYWKEQAEKIYNRTDVEAQSVYQERVVLTDTVIAVHERKCRYFREVASGDAYTLDLSEIKQTDRDITIELILKMSEPMPVDLTGILGSVGKWMNDDVPDFSEAGEYWLAFVSSDGGKTWRGSNEGMFIL